jgi:hypothetical protein
VCPFPFRILPAYPREFRNRGRCKQSAAVHRHEQKHLPALLAKSKNAQQISEADCLLERIERIIRKCELISTKAEKAKDCAPAVSALGQIRTCVELLMRITGMLKSDQGRVEVNLSNVPSQLAHLVPITDEDVGAIETRRRLALLSIDELLKERAD